MEGLKDLERLMVQLPLGSFSGLGLGVEGLGFRGLGLRVFREFRV